MDYERSQIHEEIKELLINYKYNIVDFYVDEADVSIDYVIDTDVISVVLTINVYSTNEKNLFDEISILTNNDTLFNVKYKDMPEEFCKSKIIHLIKNNLSHFKSSRV